LRALRIAPRPRFSRRPAAERPQILHQRRRDEFHAGLNGLDNKPSLRAKRSHPGWRRPRSSCPASSRASRRRPW
jgi:hypothetical protein